MRLNSSVGRSKWCLCVHGLNILLPTCSQEEKRKKKNHSHTAKEEKQRHFWIPSNPIILLGRTKISNLLGKKILAVKWQKHLFLYLFIPKERTALLESGVWDLHSSLAWSLWTQLPEGLGPWYPQRVNSRWVLFQNWKQMVSLMSVVSGTILGCPRKVHVKKWR